MPPQGIRRKVWEIVCLSVLSAMKHGRRQSRHTVCTAIFVLNRILAGAGGHVAAVRTQAVVDSWPHLRDIATWGVPNGWKSVPADHLFHGIQDDRVQHNGPVLEQHANSLHEHELYASLMLHTYHAGPAHVH